MSSKHTVTHTHAHQVTIAEYVFVCCRRFWFCCRSRSFTEKKNWLKFKDPLTYAFIVSTQVLVFINFHLSCQLIMSGSINNTRQTWMNLKMKFLKLWNWLLWFTITDRRRKKRKEFKSAATTWIRTTTIYLLLNTSIWLHITIDLYTLFTLIADHSVK